MCVVCHIFKLVEEHVQYSALFVPDIISTNEPFSSVASSHIIVYCIYIHGTRRV